MTKTILIIGGSFGSIKAAWTLRHLLDKKHRIIIISDKPRTTFRASFPRVIFENLDPEKITMDLSENFKNTGIEFICDPMTSIDQDNNQVICKNNDYQFDYLILATGVRHAYEYLPGLREFGLSVCDTSRILETREALLNFDRGNFFAGVSAGFTPCDGPPMEIIMDLHHLLSEKGNRDNVKLNYITDKEKLLPPGGPKIWKYLDEHFNKKNIYVHRSVYLTKLDKDTLYFKDGKTMPYDICLLIPPFRGIHELQNSGLIDDRGFVPVHMKNMLAKDSKNKNIYAVGDCIGNPGPKQGHLALMQATIASEHIAWRINQTGIVRMYLPEFSCVMDQGGGIGLYLYSQYMSEGDGLNIELGEVPYKSKIRFEEIFMEKKGDIGELHHQMVK
jgi:sulfide:quinone oxidoreductase